MRISLKQKPAEGEGGVMNGKDALKHRCTGNVLLGGGGGGKPFAQKTSSRKLPMQIVTNETYSRKETRAIRCKNIGRTGI